MTVALACGVLASALGAQTIERSRATATPIEHLIVVVGENISFDNLFATYEAPAGETVSNLLSRGIVDRDGNPGPHFADAAQREASVRERYLVIPPSTGASAQAAATRERPARVGCRETFPTHGSRPSWRTDHSGSRATSTSARRSAIRCIAFSRCGSKSMAAGTTFSPGSR